MVEQLAAIHLPGVQWDFSKLAAHLDELARLIGEGLPLKAMKTHSNFAVASPGALLGRISSARKRAAAGAVASRGGSSMSEAKRKACRANALRARAHKIMRFEARYGSHPEAVKFHQDLKKLRHRLSRAKCELKHLDKQENWHLRSIRTPKIQERIQSIRSEIEEKHQQLDKFHALHWQSRKGGDTQPG